MLYYACYSSSLGNLFLISNGEALTALSFSFSPESCTEKPELPIFALTKHWLDRYFILKEKVQPLEIPLDPHGTQFQKRIWRLLLDIPYGVCVSYGAIASTYVKQMGGKMSAQAIGGAVGRNPLAIIIPCHRVVASNGDLTGYAGGIDKKEALLRLEGVPLKQQANKVYCLNLPNSL